MKKISALLMSLFVAFSLFTPVHAAEKPISVVINGSEVKFDNFEPVIEKGSTLVPMRPILEELDAKVVWNKSTQTVTATKEGVDLSLQIGNKTATVNGEKKQLEVAPKTIKNVTYIPLRFIGEATGYQVDWSKALRTITFTIKVNAEGSKGFLWKVEKNGNTVYLLGSIHVAKDSMYPLRPEIEEAFKAAQHLAVEVDLTKLDPTALQAYANKLGTYSDGTTLKDHISAETYAKITALLKANKLPENTFDPYKPWIVTQTITAMGMQGTGYNTSNGIDLYFTEKANKANVPVISLETAEGQLSMFEGFSKELQEKQLVQTLDAVSQPATSEPTGIDALTDMWVSGSDDELVALTAEVEKEPEYYNALIKDRNVGMTNQVKGFLNGTDKSTYFVVVGALHMLGPDGIVTLLEKDGFTVERQ
ncbi:TraB/GumN family protein [Paenibacillus sp. FSL H8-0537]|uniref:TraB/GumN family protein n=1 Tax=Paenibacillus sp. FSL H8-0537 TaxID=2921399 RepID=UPI0031014BC2